MKKLKQEKRYISRQCFEGCRRNSVINSIAQLITRSVLCHMWQARQTSCQPLSPIAGLHVVMRGYTLSPKFSTDINLIVKTQKSFRGLAKENFGFVSILCQPSVLLCF